jgi:hypothetical protein
MASRESQNLLVKALKKKDRAGLKKVVENVQSQYPRRGKLKTAAKKSKKEDKHTTMDPEKVPYLNPRINHIRDSINGSARANQREVAQSVNVVRALKGGGEKKAAMMSEHKQVTKGAVQPARNISATTTKSTGPIQSMVSPATKAGFSN